MENSSKRIPVAFSLGSCQKNSIQEIALLKDSLEKLKLEEAIYKE